MYVLTLLVAITPSRVPTRKKLPDIKCRFSSRKVLTLPSYIGLSAYSHLLVVVVVVLSSSIHNPTTLTPLCYPVPNGGLKDLRQSFELDYAQLTLIPSQDVCGNSNLLRVDGAFYGVCCLIQQEGLRLIRAAGIRRDSGHSVPLLSVSNPPYSRSVSGGRSSWRTLADS